MTQLPSSGALSVRESYYWQAVDLVNSSSSAAHSALLNRTNGAEKDGDTHKCKCQESSYSSCF